MANEKLITLDNLRRFKQQLDEHGGGGSLYMHNIQLNGNYYFSGGSESINFSIITDSATAFTASSLMSWLIEKNVTLRGMFAIDISGGLYIKGFYAKSNSNSFVLISDNNLEEEFDLTETVVDDLVYEV